ncbi:hypothetical protein KCU81_g9321, partial [Aureobasidium melanogenum]|uniref:Zn(2)-C6 fungal-type domain-containing protein n=1 Tax=Aureobasidium melanogenum (strain CBS 110374) TaxID=1043003 RepID=A0A074VCV5_AURM1
MDDGYQDVIRGSPVDRKPDRASLDAAFGVEVQAPGPLHWYNPAVYTQAVAGATLVANFLIKESFDRSIASSIGGVTPEVNQEHLLGCDPALYHNAIQNATLNGRLLKEKFDQDIARIEYHPLSIVYPPLTIRQSTEPRAFHQRPESMPLASQAVEGHGNLASHAPEPSATRDTHTPPPHTVQANHLTHPQNTVKIKLMPHITAEEPVSVGNDQFEDATLHGRHRDHGRASHSNTTGEDAYDDIHDDAHDDAHDYGARHIPDPGNSTAAAPAHLLPPSTIEIQHNPCSAELCSKRDVDHTTNYRPPEPPFEIDHPSALQSLPKDHGSHSHDLPEHDVHDHDLPEHDHNIIQVNSDLINAYASKSVLTRPLLPSITEPLQKKNRHAVCIECWSRGLKCDAKVVCGECAWRDRPCSYVQCPLNSCPRDIMCPAYHTWRGDDQARVVGSSMHLIVLLRLDPPSSSPDYDLSEIKAMFSKPNSAASIYRRVAAEIKEEEDSGKGIDRTFVKKLVLRRGAAVASNNRALMPKVDLIVDLVAEMKQARYQEPYKQALDTFIVVQQQQQQQPTALDCVEPKEMGTRSKLMSFCTPLTTKEQIDMSREERRHGCAALDTNNTAETTQSSPRVDAYNHNTTAAQSAEHGVQSVQRQQPSIHHAHVPLSYRPRTMAHFAVPIAHPAPSGAAQAQNPTSSRPAPPVFHGDVALEPLSSSNAVPTPQHLAFDEEQQDQGSDSMCSRSCNMNDDRFTNAMPCTPRHRSRSPVLATRPLSYRDRSPARRQGSSILDPGAESEPAWVSNGAGDQNMADADVEDELLRVAELQKQRNRDAVCVHCWLKELPCDHQWPCKECKARGKACAYIACPMKSCALDVKCPAYHQYRRLPKENRKIGCPMHMIALFSLNKPLIDSYNIQKIEKKMEVPTSAQQLYLLLQEEIKDIVQQRTTLDDTMAKKLLQESEKVPPLGDKGLKIKARLIVSLVKEMKKQPFLELWEHDRRQRKFVSQERKPLEVEDTPMLDSEG